MTFMGSRADGAEMCHGRPSSKELHTQRKVVLLHMLHGSSPFCRPLSSVFAPLITDTLPSSPRILSSCEQLWPERKEGVGGGRGGRHMSKSYPWVCLHKQTAASATAAFPPPATSLFGTFPVILNVYHPGKYCVTRPSFWRQTHQWACCVWRDGLNKVTLVCAHGVVMSSAVGGQSVTFMVYRKTHIFCTPHTGSQKWNDCGREGGGNDVTHNIFSKWEKCLDDSFPKTTRLGRGHFLYVLLGLPYPRWFSPLEAGQRSSIGRAEPIGLWSRKRKRSSVRHLRRNPAKQIDGKVPKSLAAVQIKSTSSDD